MEGKNKDMYIWTTRMFLIWIQADGLNQRSREHLQLLDSDTQRSLLDLELLFLAEREIKIKFIKI